MSFDYLEILDRASDSPKISKNEWDYDKSTLAVLMAYCI